MRSLSKLLLAPALLLCAAACGDDTRPAAMDSAVIPPASARPQVAFEGQRRLAVDISAVGADLTGATIAPEDPDGPLEVVETLCNNARCGVLLRIRDTRPNMGIPIPAPIDADNHFLAIEAAAGRWRSLFSVRPLDTITNAGSTPLMVKNVQLASSANAAPGSTFRAAPGGGPVRWVVFGEATLAGTVDASGEGGEGRVGGYAGGEAGTDGSGPGGGRSGTGGAGGGGGGHAEMGMAGQGSDGTPDAGGTGGDAVGEPAMECLEDFAQTECGGGGGGGAAGTGGAGGGSFLVVALEPLFLSEGTLRANGAPGADGGGGGAGGNLLVAAPRVEAPATLEASGGAGGSSASGGDGGDGAPGRIRLDTAAGELPGAWIGPAVDLSDLDQLTDAGTLTLTGRSEPDAAIEIGDAAGGSASASTTADSAGDWTVDVPLGPGLNRLTVTATGAGGTARSWTGTNIEFVASGTTPLPVGATVDVIYVPATE